MDTKFYDDQLSHPKHSTCVQSQQEKPSGVATESSQARPIAIDLFAGVGGLSLGFEQAGFDIQAAVEVDPVHCAVYGFNFPRTHVICASAEILSGREIRERAGIGTRMIDCVFGGTPSQGFTNMGQRDSNDPRNGLVGEFFRLVCELGPRSFVFDNVKGITGGVHKKFLDQRIKLLEAEGYHVRKGFKVLNAQHFGVPQSREHFFLFGVKSGEELPNYPSPKFQAAGRPSMACDAPNGPTVQDAIGDLPDVEQFDTLCRSDQVEVSNWGVRSSYAASLRCEDHADWHFGYQREWDPNLLTSSARTEHNVVSRQRFSQTPVGKVEPISRFFKLDPAGVANTLRAGTDAARGAFSSPRPIHYAHPRCITVREMARLHGFPDWFRFHATKWHGARQVGLAVPPPLARAVATEVIKVLGFKPSEAKVTLPAPETTALGFNGTAAAQRYGVAQPIAKRQRKSAATEIKQGETGSAVGAK